MEETFPVKSNHFVWVSYLKGLQWLFESEMQKVVFSPQNKGSQHLCAWLHSCGTDGSHFVFCPDFLLCFSYSANPVQIKSCLYHLRAAGTWSSTPQEHFHSSVVGNEQDFHRLNGRVKSWLTQFWDWTQHFLMWLKCTRQMHRAGRRQNKGIPHSKCKKKAFFTENLCSFTVYISCSDPAEISL